MERLGTENRVRSPLGAATSRLRQLESELARARQRTDALGAEQERLVELERRAAEAEHRSLEAERAWLLGRIGALRTQRRELAAALDESHRLEAVAAEWQRFAIFPVEREERVIALGGQLRQAVEAGGQMTGRWEIGRASGRASVD